MKHRRHWSLKTRLSVIAAAAVTMTALSVCLTAWMLLRQSVIEQADKELQTISLGPISRVDPRTLTSSAEAPLNDPGHLYLQLVSTDGQVHAPPAQRVRLPVSGDDRTVLAGSAAYARYTVDLPEGRFRVLTVRSDQGAVQIARSLRDADDAVRRMGLVMALLAAASIAVAAIAGRVIARTGLRPIDRLTEAAAQVAATRDFGRPIAVLGDDEVARLSRAFNEMLVALDRSRRAQRRLVDDVAHELRTPMTSLRGNIELLLRAGETLPDADRVALLGDVRLQTEELGNLVTELVTLGRLESADEPETPLDFADVVRTAVDKARPRSRSATVRLHADPTPMLGRRAALERMALNLIDNALKFGPPRGTVDVVVETLRTADGAQVQLLVGDRGPGVGPADRKRVFERFYRATQARAAPGSGLGLSIVEQIVRSHGGRVAITDRPGGGAAVYVRFPCRPMTPLDVPMTVTGEDARPRVVSGS